MIMLNRFTQARIEATVVVAGLDYFSLPEGIDNMLENALEGLLRESQPNLYNVQLAAILFHSLIHSLLDCLYLHFNQSR